MGFLILQRGLWVACLAAQVLLIGAILQRRIARQYRFFSSVSSRGGVRGRGAIADPGQHAGVCARVPIL